jgi:hypothetical protein
MDVNIRGTLNAFQSPAKPLAHTHETAVLTIAIAERPFGTDNTVLGRTFVPQAFP